MIALSLFFLREPGRGRNEQEAVLGHVLSEDDEPPVRLSAVSARLNKVKTFRYLTLGIGMLGFALVSVPSRLSFLFEETYHFDAFKRGWVLSITYIPALVVIPIAGRYGDRLFRRDPRWAVRLFGWLVIGYGVFIAIGSQLGPVALLIVFVAIANGFQLAAFTQVGPIISAVVPYRMRAQAFALVGFYVFLLGGFFGGLMVAAVADEYGERTALIAIAPLGAILGGLARAARGEVHEARHLARGRRAPRRAGGAATYRRRSRQRAGAPGPQRRHLLRTGPDSLRHQPRGETR